MAEYEVYSFTKEYKLLTTDARKKSKYLFEIGVAVAHVSELERGFMVERQYNTTKKGTLFKFRKIKDKEEYLDYTAKIRELLQNTSDMTAKDILDEASVFEEEKERIDLETLFDGEEYVGEAEVKFNYREDKIDE